MRAEAVKVAEYTIIDNADETIEFHQRVLQGCGREQHLGMDVRHCVLERLGDDVAGLVDVAQAMGLVQDDQVPLDFLDIFGLGLGELIGADDRAGFRQKGACCPCLRAAL